MQSNTKRHVFGRWVYRLERESAALHVRMATAMAIAMTPISTLPMDFRTGLDGIIEGTGVCP